MAIPGKFKGSKYYRRIRVASRSGKLELHDRRLNPIKRHFYGKDTREFRTIPISTHIRKGRLVRSTIRRK